MFSNPALKKNFQSLVEKMAQSGQSTEAPAIKTSDFEINFIGAKGDGNS